jgi:hypothetical protein
MAIGTSHSGQVQASIGKQRWPILQGKLQVFAHKIKLQISKMRMPSSHIAMDAPPPTSSIQDHASRIQPEKTFDILRCDAYLKRLKWRP